MTKVLVVGDWVVDEHWVTGVHRSPTSSRVGHAHSRVLQHPNNASQSLCGAGQSASVIYGSTANNDRWCDVVGVGLWADSDTDILTSMLAAPTSPTYNPYHLGQEKNPLPDGVKLINLGDAVRKERSTSVLYGTTKAIRIYQHTGSVLELLQRIDWELPIPSNDTVWINKVEELASSELGCYLSVDTSDIKAVVIKDMNKGVVSSALIKFLADKLSTVPWYVSTKAWRPLRSSTTGIHIENEEQMEEPAEHPSWFNDLPKASVKLLLIPHVAAKRAIQDGSLTCWLTKSGVPSKKALTAVDELSARFRNAAIVVLPDGLSVLARDAASRNPNSGFQQGETEATSLNSAVHAAGVGVPMASVFFAAVTAHMVYEEETSFENALQSALTFTHDWIVREIKRLEEPENPDVPAGQITLDVSKSASHCGFESWLPVDWSHDTEQWQQALSDRGIVDVDGKPSIQLWRAMTEVDGYVCCIKSRRDAVQKLTKELSAFRTNPSRHRSLLIVARPGDGKTHLVRQLSKSLGLSALQFNVTQMLSKSDILDCFDTIVTTQAQSPGKNLLIFFDEINAVLDAQHVYDAFLAPIEEGVYVRGGKTFHIEPCAWFFAATEHPDPQADKSMKAGDFLSRLSIPPVDFKIDKNEIDEASVETVYLGVTLLRTVFPDVRKVSDKVLTAFSMVSADVETRKIVHFVKAFVDIQYGQVMARNLPKEIFKGLTVHYERWHATPETRVIDIFG